MTDLVAEAVHLDRFLQSRGWRYCFIGGLSVQHWGEPRLTRDLDLSLLTGFGSEALYVDALLSVYPPRMDWNHIEKNLEELARAKDDLTLLERLRKIRESVADR